MQKTLLIRRKENKIMLAIISSTSPAETTWVQFSEAKSTLIKIKIKYSTLVSHICPLTILYYISNPKIVVKPLLHTFHIQLASLFYSSWTNCKPVSDLMKESEGIVFKFLTQTASNGRSVGCLGALYLTAPVSGSKLKPLKCSAAPQSEFAVKDAFFPRQSLDQARTHSRVCLHLSGWKFSFTNFL